MMTRAQRFLVVVATCVAVGVAAGAIVSVEYWGFPFRRPGIPEVAKATAVRSVTSLRAGRRGAQCTLEVEPLPDLRQELADQREYVDEFPYLRALVVLEERGLLPPEARAPEWLEPSTFYQAVADTGILIPGDAGYDTGGCFGGYVLELDSESGAPWVLLTAGGPEVSNDHHPHYEVLFRREGTRLRHVRSRVSFYDIAGVEGLEWPLLHGVFVVLCLSAAGFVAAVLMIGKTLARSVERRLGWS